MQAPDRYLPHIVAALVVSILPHTLRLPAWIALWCVLIWGYQLLLTRVSWPQPGRGVRLLLAAAGILGLLSTYSFRLGPNAFLGLLAVMAALKPFEIRTHRDRMITLFLAYFIVITSLFQSESLAVTLYMFVSVLVTTGVLIRINDPAGSLKGDLRLAAVIMAQALPLMAILFLLFPRIQGSLVGLPRPAAGARTGFSERLSPGSISRLVQTDEVAFRAEFEGERPGAGHLYWRGIVFHRFDGRTWRRMADVPEIEGRPGGESRISYTIALEPHDRKWLFALDRPAGRPKWSRMYADFTIRNHRPVNRKKYYPMTAVTRPGKGPRWGVEEALQLPPAGNPRSRGLAKQLAKGASGAQDVVKRGLEWLREKDFRYTLRPPTLGEDPVDDFLFDSRRGYCEHYASAYAFLMRAAGVSARIVGGYQGGSVNPYGDYFIIRQSDAHAWVEVWDKSRGWVRVDPTAAVAPERITGGAAAALPEGEWPGSRQTGLAGWLENLRLGWDAVSTRWEAWFSGYSQLEQRALLKRLGIPLKSWKGPAVILLLVFGGIFLVVALYALFQLKPAASEKDRVRQCYGKFCKKLARAGIRRRSDQGPASLAADIHRLRPDIAAEAEEILGLYIRLRYEAGEKGDDEALFCRRVREFKPGRPPAGVS
jgi:transglutaminase-like putative cysteine protease